MLPSDGGVYVQVCQCISFDDVLLWGSLCEMFFTSGRGHVTWRRWSFLASLSSVTNGRPHPVWALTSTKNCIRVYLKSVNACCHSVQNILFSSLLPENLKVSMYRNIILPADRMGVKLGRTHWGRNVGWRCLRIGCRGKYLELGGTSKNGSWEDYTIRSLMIRTAQSILFG